MITIGEIKKNLILILNDHNIPDSQFEVISIIAYSLGLDHKEVITENDINISDEGELRVFEILKKRLEGNPLAYLINEKTFFNEIFFIDQNVLIPRQETEEVIEYFFSLNQNNSMENKNILDIGTGSGIISIICKKKYPLANLFSIDKSNGAINVAKKNAEIKNVSIDFMCTDIQNCKISKIDYVISNPPYIKQKILKDLQIEVLKEPLIALNGGLDGLKVIKNIFEWEKNINNNNALQIIIEIDEQIKYEAEELAKNFYPHKKIKIINDIANKPRILSIN